MANKTLTLGNTDNAINMTFDAGGTDDKARIFLKPKDNKQTIIYPNTTQLSDTSTSESVNLFSGQIDIHYKTDLNNLMTIKLGGNQANYPFQYYNHDTNLFKFTIDNNGYIASGGGAIFMNHDYSPQYKHQLKISNYEEIGNVSAQHNAVISLHRWNDNGTGPASIFQIDKIGRMTAVATSSSWYDSHADFNATYNIYNAPDNSGYHPWLRQYNPYSNVVCTIGEYQGSIYLTSRNSATYGTQNVAGKSAYLSSNGTFYCAGNFSTSDKKKKDHIGYLKEDSQLENFIMSLQPAKFTLKDGDAKRTHMGFYAQDVRDQAESTIGDLAAYQAAVLEDSGECGLMPTGYFDPAVPDKDLNWYMDYKELIAPTIAMVQKLKDEIDELKVEIKNLKGE